MSFSIHDLLKPCRCPEIIPAQPQYPPQRLVVKAKASVKKPGSLQVDAEIWKWLNQTTMAALSMVIIVAVIGGFDDIGWEVLAAMCEAALGRRLLSGLVIVILAVLLDRITAGLAEARPERRLSARGFWVGTALALLIGLAMRLALPGRDFLPDALTHGLSKGIDAGLMTFVTWSEPAFSAFRDGLTYGLMLPLRIGLQGAASPAVWGFALQPWMIAGYALVTIALAVWAYRRNPAAGYAVIFAALALFTGLARLPWPGVIALALFLARRSGGARLVLLTGAGLGLILLSGLWSPFAQSACGHRVLPFSTVVGLAYPLGKR